MKKISNLFFTGFLLILCGLIYTYKTDLALLYLEKIAKEEIIVTLDKSNEYTKKDNYDYVQQIEKFDIKNKNDLLNAYYSIFNSGVDEFSFYCLYDGCQNDITDLTSSRTILSTINSFVHPYNSFSDIETKITSLGKVTVTIKKQYTESEIEEINKEVDKIISSEIKNVKDDNDKIKLIHDYIIKQSKYDSDRSDRNIINYKSHLAYGPLIEKKGICSGYSDAMAIFLEKLEIKNYKVISENHIWNAVYIDNEWFHLDLTWDDPVVNTGEDVLEYNIFLITTEELEALNDSEHNFDKNIFSEVIKKN